MAAPLSGRRIFSFLLFFGGSVLGALFLTKYFNLDILGAATAKLKKRKEDSETGERLVSDQNEGDEKVVHSELVKVANLALSVPQPESSASKNNESSLDSRNVRDEKQEPASREEVKEWVENLVQQSVVKAQKDLHEGTHPNTESIQLMNKSNSNAQAEADFSNLVATPVIKVNGGVLKEDEEHVASHDFSVLPDAESLMTKNASGILDGDPEIGNGDSNQNGSITESPESIPPVEEADKRGDSAASDFSLLSDPEISVLSEPENLDSTGGEEDASLGAVVFGSEDHDVSSPTTSPEPTSTPAGQPTDDDIRATFSILRQNGGGALTAKHAQVLVHLIMTSQSDDDVIKVLGVVQNCAAFTQSQNLLREAGCLTALRHLLDVTMTSSSNTAKMAAVNGAIANLSVNEENQKVLQECIPSLIDLLQSSTPDRSTRLSSLQALTNLSTSQQYHGSYTRAIQELYWLLESDDSAIARQAASVLVNLSTNQDMVPHLLAAKAPESGLASLLSQEQPELLLRLTTFLSNVTCSVAARHLDPSHLPVDEKAASPETMYTALYGVDNMKVKSRVFVLSQNEHEEISAHAKRTYTNLIGS